MAGVLGKLENWVLGEAGVTASELFAGDVRVDSPLGVGSGAAYLPQPHGARLITSGGDDEFGGLVYEDQDPVTGLWARLSLLYFADSAVVHRLYVQSSAVPTPEQRAAPIFGPEDPAYLQTTFGFRAPRPGGDGQGLSLAEAESLVSHVARRALVYEIDGRFVDYDRDGVLVSDELFYLPFGWIGCAGYLVERKTKRVIALGSALSVDAQIWAWYRGIPLGTGQRNDVEITEVRDRVELTRVLCRLLDGRLVHSQLVPRLQMLPCTIENLNLFFVCEDLRRAERLVSFSDPRGAGCGLMPCAASGSDFVKSTTCRQH